MSQVKTLPITTMRWLSLLLCAMAATTITVLLSKVGFVQKAYSSWSAILNASPVLHYSSAFLAGIGLKLLLDKFYISHPKRSIGFNWRYPPVTMSLWLSVTIIGATLYFTSNQEELIAATSCFEYFIVLILGSSIITAYQQSNERISLNLVVCFSLIAVISTAFIYWDISHAGFSWPLFITVDIYIFSAIFLIIKYINECIKAKWKRNQITLERTTSVNPSDFKTLGQFKNWFKDDSTIKSTEELEPDLQVYATRITERLKNGGGKYEKDLAQHIALCGPYGCGKSSIVESIVNDLAKNAKKQSTWIHSDISTWGAASGSVAHVVLSHIIDDISQHIDMCAFRALPKHYTEALKSGGSVFQFASTLLAGPVDIERSFQKLNDVLYATNHKLLITLQDVDRGTGDENEKRLNDIAVLLDRLKNRDLSHINFIVAMGNEKPNHAVVLSKVADHIETIISQDFKSILCKWAKLCTKEVFEKDMLLTHCPISSSERYFNQNPLIFGQTFYQPAIISNNFIVSIRVLKRVMRRVSKCWTKEKLLGEVDFGSLLLLTTLREVEPVLFNAFANSYTSLINGKVENGRQKTINETLSNLIADFTNSEATHVYNALFKELLNLIEDINDKSGNSLKRSKNSDEQHLGVKPDSVDYLKRVLLETVPENELRDQEVLKEFKTILPENIEKLANRICIDHRWLVSFERFNGIFGAGDDIENKNKRKSLAFAILNNKHAEKSSVLSPQSTFENTLLRTVVIEGHFEKVLNKLAGIESAQALLFRILTWHYSSLFISQKLPELRVSKDSKGHYFDVEESEDRRKIAEKAKSFTQNIDFRKFLIENLDQLNMESIELTIHYLVFTQFDDSKFNFDEKRMENILSICLASVSANATLLLINNAKFAEHETIYFRKYLLKVTTDHKVDLKNKIQCFQHEDITEDQKIKVINNLGLSEE